MLHGRDVLHELLWVKWALPRQKALPDDVRAARRGVSGVHYTCSRLWAIKNRSAPGFPDLAHTPAAGGLGRSKRRWAAGTFHGHGGNAKVPGKRQ